MAKRESSRLEDPVVARINDCLRYLIQESNFMQLASWGIQEAQGLPRALRVLSQSKFSDFDIDKDPSSVAFAETQSEFAREQAKLGYPILHNHATVSIWGALESMILDVSALWIQHHPERVDLTRLQGIKVSLPEILNADAEQRSRIVVDEVERRARGQHLTAVSYFEAILGSVGLGGRTRSETRKALFELSKVRNLLVHRGGRVDSRFRNSCPWIRATMGAEFRVTRSRFSRYFRRSIDYIETVSKRIDRKIKSTK